MLPLFYAEQLILQNFSQSIDLETPLRANMTDTRDPIFVKNRIKIRRLVETVIGQLTDH